MKNNGEKNKKCDCVNKSICDGKLDKVVGGGMDDIFKYEPSRKSPYKTKCRYITIYNLFKSQPGKKELIKELHQKCIFERAKGFNCDQCSENCELYKLDADSL